MNTEPAFDLHGDLPLIVTPQDPELPLKTACAWLEDNPEWVQEKLLKHGAILFRNFAVASPEDFEQLARAVDDDLKNNYLGTSPRDALTDFVFNASELPDFYPIPQHCEMSFTAHPPRRVFFCCLVEPAADSGETPLCDFRQVWNDLDQGVKQRFEAGGIRHIRNYAAPGTDTSDDPTQLKPWPDMFHTTDKAVVQEMCAEEEFDVEWVAGDALRLTSSQPVTRNHPVTGEPVWHNHLTTFHAGTAAAEYERITRLRPSERHKGFLEIARELDRRLRATPSEERGMHTTYLDGSEIPDDDIEAVRDAVWKNLSLTPWKRGDVVAIDNHSVSHGRLPYEGPRHIVVCWA